MDVGGIPSESNTSVVNIKFKAIEQLRVKSVHKMRKTKKCCEREMMAKILLIIWVELPQLQHRYCGAKSVSFVWFMTNNKGLQIYWGINWMPELLRNVRFCQSTHKSWNIVYENDFIYFKSGNSRIWMDLKKTRMHNNNPYLSPLSMSSFYAFESTAQKTGANSSKEEIGAQNRFKWRL